MPFILKSPRDKGEIVDLLLRNVEAFLFKGLSPDEVTAIRNHLDWLRNQPDEIFVEATIAATYDNRQTSIVLRVSTVPPVPQEPKQ